MKIELNERNAFLAFSDGHLLCIGTRAEVEEASAKEDGIQRLIIEALALNQYDQVVSGKGMVLH